MEGETFIAWSEAGGGPGIGASLPFDGKPATAYFRDLDGGKLNAFCTSGCGLG